MSLASIFNPVDESLESKVKAVREVQKSYFGVKSSLDYSKANGFDSALGTEEELKEALEISQNSYHQAVKALSDSEMKKARQEKLITTEEFQKLSVEKHKAKVQSIRGNDKNKSHTKDHSHKK